ncbi:hypothetical protein GCL60_03670 [Silvanigrella paludirubra]|uniref:Uncharacterized protein n=1 Tax=Silvanigrella paludirubra TaxID=2499159 RepID=A0A6N6W029_9BACT|nr:hypothetical protein [Silvanigrella paludirubra]KAB8041046.1 hypothetical protein GCL60_03670 [Silvanigrella paludirubra]
MKILFMRIILTIILFYAGLCHASIKQNISFQNEIRVKENKDFILSTSVYCNNFFVESNQEYNNFLMKSKYFDKKNCKIIINGIIYYDYHSCSQYILSPKKEELEISFNERKNNKLKEYSYFDDQNNLKSILVLANIDQFHKIKLKLYSCLNSL